MYFAKIDENNVVVEVVVADQEVIKNREGTWIETDLKGVSPKNYAGIGFKYDSILGGFIPPAPFPSWVLNEKTCQYEAPVEKPKDFKKYVWDEQKLVWAQR